jgi:hypothetical protein
VVRLVSGFSQASWIEDKGVSDWAKKGVAAAGRWMCEICVG